MLIDCPINGSRSAHITTLIPPITYPMERFSELIRTARKRNSYLVEIKSYLTEKPLIENRTWWKRDREKSFDFDKINNHFKSFHFISRFNDCIILNRTGRKPNSYHTETKSYLTEKKLHLIRTWWKSIRTARKRAFDFIKEKGFLRLSINTFLYINKGIV